MKRILLLLSSVLSLPALADRLPLPADTPPAYREECGSCHLAYPPALLAAEDWRKLLGSLDRHFGSDATLDPKNAALLTAFLNSHAGQASRLGKQNGNPPRITQTGRFIRKHHEVPARFWRDARIKSAANCEACHRGAANGHFGEHDIAIPELRE